MGRRKRRRGPCPRSSRWTGRNCSESCAVESPPLVLFRSSSLILIWVNLWVLFGVLFLGWSVLAVAMTFWFEGVIVGFYNILKMLLARRPTRVNDPYEPAWLTIPLFTVYYGGFSLVYGFSLALILGRSMPTAEIILNAPVGVLVGCGLLFLSHGFSFARNYVKRREYLEVGPGDLMIQPWRRIAAQHVLVVLGSFVSLYMPRLFAALLIPVKIWLDLHAHAKERQRYGRE